jgi:hypothetical protein
MALVYEGLVEEPKGRLVPEGSVTVQGAPDEGLPKWASTGGGAAMGRPRMVDRTNVLPEPRPTESFLAGVTKTAIDPLVGAAQLATGGNLGTSQLAQRLGQEAEAYSQENPMSYGSGRVVGAVLPAAGMSKAIGTIPSFSKLNPYLQGAAIGSGTGAVSGALQPVESGQTGQQMYNEMGGNARTGALIGTGVGAAAPAVGQLAQKAYQGGKAFVEPFFESGQEKILGRFLREMSGGEEAKAMRNLRNPKMLVEGSQPTAAEVAGVPSLAALERTLIATSPTAGNLAAQRQAQNAQAQAAALRNIAPPSRTSKYVDFREQVADDLYADALKPLNLGKLDKKTQAEIDGLISRPAIKDAMEIAKETSANRGVDIADPAGSMLGLHRTKIALDKKIGEVKARYERDKIKSASGDELDGLQNAKTALLGFMEKVSPTYKTARVNYERLSKPIEQLESIAKLADKSISPENEKIYISQFSKGLKELKQSGVVSDRQIARLEAIKEDLARGKFAATAGKSVGSDTVQKLAYKSLMEQTGLPISATSKIGKFFYGDINEELKNKLAESVLSPKETLRLMRLGNQPKAKMDAKERNDLARLLTIQGLQRTGQSITGAENE